MSTTLYDFAGGRDALQRLAQAHHERCIADPELNHPFSHEDLNPQHVERLASYWAEVFGGPADYSRTCGTQTDLLAMHAGNGDLTDLSRRFVECFVAAADDAGLPADPVFRAALRAYMEWATVQFNAHPDGANDVAPDLAVPRWNWDGPVAALSP